MEIELKNVKTFLRKSKKYLAYVVDVHIDGVKAGIANTNGYDYKLSFAPVNPTGAKLLAQAQKWVKNIHEGWDDLDSYIYDLVVDIENQKQSLKLKKKKEKEMLTGIIVGRPNEADYGYFKLRLPIASMPDDYDWRRIINQVKVGLKPGETVLNTNLPMCFWLDYYLSVGRAVEITKKNNRVALCSN